MDSKTEQLIVTLCTLAKDEAECVLIAHTLIVLDAQYGLSKKMDKEPGVGEIIKQLMGRIERAFGRVSKVKGQRILDLACGSHTSKAPATLYIDSPFGEARLSHFATEGYTAQFEPWFCRILLALGAEPVGIDLGDLEGEGFEHYQVDLGLSGALDFLPNHSFDAIQDSRLFGSPEFTAQFPDEAARLNVAQELKQQARRLLKTDGIVIHSDAEHLLR